MTPSDFTNGVKRRFPLEKTDENFVQEVRNLYQLDVDADQHNIEPAREDIQFVIGDQWDERTKTRRDRLNKPTLTVNRLPAFVAQYLGSWQQTDTAMRLIPMKGGSKMVAEIRQGLIRTIQKTPKAKHAMYTAMETAYIGGIGNFGLDIVDNKFDVFVKDLAITAFDDPFQVVWDRNSREPSGSDANHCFAMHWMTKRDFKKAYPKATGTGWESVDGDWTTMTSHGWEVDEMIRLCHFWQMKEEDAVVALEKETGDIIDVTDWPQKAIDAVAQLDDEGEPMVRETTRPYAECYVMDGKDVIDGPFRLNISRVPIFRVEGWALQESSVRFRWGFVRNAKDPQRLHNYWRSILAEELQKSPASKWLLDQSAMRSGLADHFRNQHLSGDPVLFWDSQADGVKPERIDPPLMNQAVLTEAQMSVQDIKDVTNKHEASLGVTSNEVSGKAITARQRVSELGDRIYLENMNTAQAECAKVINELIGEVYDTHRVIKVTGDDDKVVLQEINGDFGDDTPDITKGVYDITYTTGPSYATMREEATETMLTLMNHMPQTGNYIVDLIAENMDIPGAEKIAERMMMLLPPEMIDPERLPERSRQKVEAMRQRKAQEAEEQQQFSMAQFQLQMGQMQAQIDQLVSQAQKNMAQAALAESQSGVDAAKVQSQHELGTDENLIRAAQVGVDIDKNEIKMAEVGMDAAFRVGEQQERNADREERRSQQTTQETDDGQV